MRVLVAAAVVVLGMERVAWACSPELPKDIPPPCDTMTVHTPGESFPVDLAANGFYVSVAHKDGVYGYESPVNDAFPLKQPLSVFRALESGGFEAARFGLADISNGGDSSRILRMIDPKPGHYYVAWEGDTCKMQSSPAGGGKAVDDFTLTPSVPRPTILGTLAPSVSGTKGRDFQEGEDGMCRPVMIHVDETEVTLTLTPAADVAPWADALTTGLEVDGETLVGYAKPNAEQLRAGQYSVKVTRACASDTPRYVQNPGIAEGRHKARMLALFADQTNDIATAEVAFEVHCDLSHVSANAYVPSGDGGVAKAPAKDDGCNASGANPSPSLLSFLGLALAASVVRRARARR